MALAASDFIAAVDAFLDAEKTVIGADGPLNWVAARDEGMLCIKLPLAINDVQHGQTLMVSSTPNSPFPHFHVAVIWGTAVCRVDFDGLSHGNSAAMEADHLPAVVHGPHYHSWSLNRRFVVSAREHLRLPLAAAVPANVRQFDAALRWFCADNKIILPPRHTIALPARTRLL